LERCLRRIGVRRFGRLDSPADFSACGMAWWGYRPTLHRHSDQSISSSRLARELFGC
jgi:hypothetical protein